MDLSKIAERDPDEQTRRLARSLRELKTQCLDDAALAGDPGLKSLMLTAAEVLSGLERAFRHLREPGEGWSKRH